MVPGEASEAESARPANRLLAETSPYLRQHAYNPVQWFPWGEEALSAARREQRPIFLSIGYSACHWCHVMEHESFENADVARLMNDWFINIKVDREERPDLDQIYMSAVQLLTHRGGWPMSVFLTPDLQPFYGGTYWPPEARHGMPGFRDILRGVHEAWENRRHEVLDSAARLTQAIVEVSAPRGNQAALQPELIQRAARELTRTADRRYGGFGRAPKFPHPMDLRVLFRAAVRFRDRDAFDVARLTLDRMAHGGIYDHLGGGFHRYSTDERWLVPHFEKMLYDNALLVPAYLESFQLTQAPDDARVVRETLDYVLREMTDPAGGFYSTQDADSEGVEGKFFVWQADEIERLLGADVARVFNRAYDVTAHGNWEEANILNRPTSHAAVAALLGKTPEELDQILAPARETLRLEREKRVHPGRDDKILASWNGLMLSAFAQAADVLDEPRYAEAARRGAEFALREFRQPDGSLRHSVQHGQARFNGYLDDYASLALGLVDVFQATGVEACLAGAVELADQMLARFGDADRGGFFYTSHDHEQLIARNKDLQDNATPCGNSLAATALLKLARLTGRRDFEDHAVRTLEVLAPIAHDYPAAAGQTLLALDFHLGPAPEIVVIEGADPAENAAVRRALHAPCWPNKLVVWRTADQSAAEPPALLQSLVAGKQARQGRATIYVCDHGACGLPVVGVEGLQKLLATRPELPAAGERGLHSPV